MRYSLDFSDVCSILTISLIENAFGDGTITIFASDDEGDSDSGSFNIHILDVNDAPVIDDILDPDAIILGGGVSNVPFLYDEGKIGRASCRERV